MNKLLAVLRHCIVGVSKKLKDTTTTLHTDVVGTPAYIAPEVWNEIHQTDCASYHRTNLYILGTPLHFMLTECHTWRLEQVIMSL